ncbi:MAG: polysaccharide deacetylase family protein [Alphaproteobacteria bacterium]|nr:polysaccharide deacetylase family protein [Alphaproteobacteria bacterium]
MTAQVYLTIDDSPSTSTDALRKFLNRNRIPALFFCRGDMLDLNPGPAIRLVQDGFVLGNHSYSHTPSGQLGADATMEEVERTEALIEAAYIEAGKARPGYYFRFPYVDRGDGDRLERRFGEIVEATEQGRTLRLHAGSARSEDVDMLQDFLQGTEFRQPFALCNHPLYRNPAIAGAADCFFTYTAGDWMLRDVHKGKWAYTSIHDLKKKIDDDPWLMKDGNTGIALFHDHPEIIDVTIELIGYMKDRGTRFLPII